MFRSRLRPLFEPNLMSQGLGTTRCVVLLGPDNAIMRACILVSKCWDDLLASNFAEPFGMRNHMHV